MATTHQKIRGVRGGQPDKTLVSFDKPAFQSGGWDQGANSATCSACAEAYVLALNNILDQKRKPVRSDGTPTGAGTVTQGAVAVAFWTREPDQFHPADILNEPSPEDVELLFRAREGGVRAPANGFYALALSANGARLVVRDWIETTVPEAREALARWFEDLRIVLARDLREGKAVIRAGGELAPPPRLRDLCLATAREETEVAPVVPVELIRAALKFAPLSAATLDRCLRRVRVATDDPKRSPRFTPARAALIRCALNRFRKEEDPFMEPALVEDCRDPGYLCGRLLAVLGRLQYLALGHVGATVVDRFYGRASTAPQSAFPLLLKLARHHMAKANEERPGSGTNAEADIRGILSLLPVGSDAAAGFPAMLNLPGQGRFALGFYHQQARYRGVPGRTSTTREQATDAGSVDAENG